MSDESEKSLKRSPIDIPEQRDPDPSYQSGEHLPREPYPSPDDSMENGHHLPTTRDPTKNKPTPIDDLRPDLGPDDARSNQREGSDAIESRAS